MRTHSHKQGYPCPQLPVCVHTSMCVLGGGECMCRCAGVWVGGCVWGVGGGGQCRLLAPLRYKALNGSGMLLRILKADTTDIFLFANQAFV